MDDANEAGVPAGGWAAEERLTVRREHLNTYRQVFGGYVIARVDDVATGLVARISGRSAVTAHLRRMSFVAGVALGQRMHLRAEVAATHRTSAEVAVRVEGEDPGTGARWPASDAVVTVVAVDDAGRPAAVPSLRAGQARARPGRALTDASAALRLPADVSHADAARIALQESVRIAVPGVAAPDRASAGWVLSAADELAAVSASMHSAMPCVTAAVEGVSFGRPVPVGDVVLLRSYVSATFRSSMEVRVEAWVRGRYARGPLAHVADCSFIYVALGADGRPVAVPPFVPQSERERVLAAEASARRDARRAR